MGLRVAGEEELPIEVEKPEAPGVAVFIDIMLFDVSKLTAVFFPGAWEKALKTGP